MSENPRDLTLERINRLTVAVAGLSESYTAQGRQLLAMVQRVIHRLERIEAQIMAIRTDIAAIGAS